MDELAYYKKCFKAAKNACLDIDDEAVALEKVIAGYKDWLDRNWVYDPPKKYVYEPPRNYYPPNQASYYYNTPYYSYVSPHTNYSTSYTITTTNNGLIYKNL